MEPYLRAAPDHDLSGPIDPKAFSCRGQRRKKKHTPLLFGATLFGRHPTKTRQNSQIANRHSGWQTNQPEASNPRGMSPSLRSPRLAHDDPQQRRAAHGRPHVASVAGAGPRAPLGELGLAKFALGEGLRDPWFRIKKSWVGGEHQIRPPYPPEGNPRGKTKSLAVFGSGPAKRAVVKPSFQVGLKGSPHRHGENTTLGPNFDTCPGDVHVYFDTCARRHMPSCSQIFSPGANVGLPGQQAQHLFFRVLAREKPSGETEPSAPLKAWLGVFAGLRCSGPVSHLAMGQNPVQ